MSAAEAPRFADWRDRHAGATVVVCGCGRSLLDLAEPGRVLTIGVNDVGRRFTPDYLVVVNPQRQFAPERWRHVAGSRARAVFTQLGDLRAPESTVVRFRLGRRGGVGPPDGETLDYSNNSPFVAVQLARHLGARRIGLLGVDFGDDHFFGATGRHPLAAHLAVIDREYAALAAALRAEGRELVNLGAGSRLTALPRARLDGAGGWRPAAPATVAVESRPRVTVAVERSGTGAIGRLLDTIAATAGALGHPVRRDVPRHARLPGTITVVWNGRSLPAGGPTVYCEHGWLPRSDYQVSARGINALSCAADFRWDGRPLAAAEAGRLDARLHALRRAAERNGETAGSLADLPPAFLLVPLQVEGDTNIVHHAPPGLRTMRALIERVSAADPPWPVVFKQHPADARGANAQLRLVPRRRGDVVRPHARGSVHALLASGRCRGIVTINSNVAHDGLLWGVPAVTLGRGVWPAEGERTPFLTAVPDDWATLAASAADPAAVACRRAYALHLVERQWTLATAADPARVGPLLAAALATAPAGRAAAEPVPARAGPPRLVVLPAARPRAPVVNVVARDRGWLFAAWQRALAAGRAPGFEVRASAEPLADASAWLFVRAAEAAATPDPARTAVQIHDLAGDGIYRPGGARAAVADCAAIALAHPAQEAILAADGIVLDGRRTLVRPVGWQPATPHDGATPRVPTVAWAGRPVVRDGVDESGLATFVAAVRLLGRGVRVTLVGERLEAAGRALRGAGVAVDVHGLADHPLQRAPVWLSRCDAVVVTSAADAAPWPLFDALRAGVPVVAPPIGWAAGLLADGRAGRLATGPDATATALAAILAERDGWRRRRPEIRARVAPYGIAAWVAGTLDLVAGLARPDLREAI